MDATLWIALAVFTMPAWLGLFVGLFCFWVYLPTWILDWAVRK